MVTPVAPSTSMPVALGATSPEAAEKAADVSVVGPSTSMPVALGATSPEAAEKAADVSVFFRPGTKKKIEEVAAGTMLAGAPVVGVLSEMAATARGYDAATAKIIAASAQKAVEASARPLAHLSAESADRSAGAISSSVGGVTARLSRKKS